MQLTCLLRAAVIVVLTSSLVPALAQQVVPGAVAIGAIAFSIPAPPGFVDPTAAAPQIVAAINNLVPPTNRMLRMFMLTSDLNNFLAGKPYVMERYFLLQTIKAAEVTSASREEFEHLKKMVKAQSSRELEVLLQNAQSIVDEGARKLGKKYDDRSFKVKMSELKARGVYRETENSISVLTTSYIEAINQGKVSSRPIVSGTTFSLIKGKVLFSYSYSAYRSEADIQWVRDVSGQWEQAITQAN